MMTTTDRYLAPDRFTRRVANPLMAWMVRRGLGVRGAQDERLVEAVRDVDRGLAGGQHVRLARSRSASLGAPAGSTSPVRAATTASTIFW